MKKLLIMTCLMLVWAPLAGADVIATYKYRDGSKVTLVTRDRDHVRMDTSPTSYMLLQKDKVYSVSKTDAGQWEVMDMAQMKAMVPAGMTSLFNGGDTQVAHTSLAFEKTGRKETIAGYTGQVFEVVVKENGKAVEKDEVVLCSHADLEKVNQGWTAFGEKMGQIMGGDLAKSVKNAADEAAKAGYGGMLRYGRDMALEKLTRQSLDNAYYQIPKGAKMLRLNQMQMPGAGIQNGGTSTSAGQAPSSADQAGNVLEKDAADVGETAHQAAKDATMDEVREGVQTLFKSIFD